MNMLVIPRSAIREFYGDRAFSVCALKLLNNLPQHTKCSPDLRTFTSRLKTHLFKHYFNLLKVVFYYLVLSILKLLL